MQIFRMWRRPMLAAGSVFASFFLSGCVSNNFVSLFTESPYLVGPESYLNQNEIQAINNDENLAALVYNSQSDSYTIHVSPEVKNEFGRNRFVLAKMFIIDRNYHEYETHLTREDGSANFLGSIASLGASTAATAIPVGQTTKILSATVTGITSSKEAFKSDVLKTKTIQNIETQMRTDRAKQAKAIFDRLSCDINSYPIFFALADLEAYRQAGTLKSAQQALAKSLAAAEEKAEEAKVASSKVGSKGAIKSDAEIIKEIKGILKIKPQVDCPIDVSPFSNHKTRTQAEL